VESTLSQRYEFNNSNNFSVKLLNLHNIFTKKALVLSDSCIFHCITLMEAMVVRVDNPSAINMTMALQAIGQSQLPMNTVVGFGDIIVALLRMVELSSNTYS